MYMDALLHVLCEWVKDKSEADDNMFLFGLVLFVWSENSRSVGMTDARTVTLP